jgi:hypothetical protein
MVDLECRFQLGASRTHEGRKAVLVAAATPGRAKALHEEAMAAKKTILLPLIPLADAPPRNCTLSGLDTGLGLPVEETGLGARGWLAVLNNTRRTGEF